MTALFVIAVISLQYLPPLGAFLMVVFVFNLMYGKPDDVSGGRKQK